MLYKTCCKTILLFKSCWFYLLNLFQVQPPFCIWPPLPAFRSLSFLAIVSVTEPGSFCPRRSKPKILKCWGLQQREGFFARHPTEMGQVKFTSLKARGWGIYGVTNKNSRMVRGVGSVVAWGNAIEKRWGHCLSEQVYPSYRPLRVQNVPKWTLTHAQCQWSLCLHSSAQTRHSWLQVPGKQLGQTSFCLGSVPFGGHATLLYWRLKQPW